MSEVPLYVATPRTSGRPPSYTLDYMYGPFIKCHFVCTQLTLGRHVVHIWSSHPLRYAKDLGPPA